MVKIGITKAMLNTETMDKDMVKVTMTDLLLDTNKFLVEEMIWRI